MASASRASRLVLMVCDVAVAAVAKGFACRGSFRTWRILSARFKENLLTFMSNSEFGISLFVTSESRLRAVASDDLANDATE